MTRSFNILETLLVVFFITSLSLILTFLFPQPYYFFGIFDIHSMYDAEADYFANIISTYINGYPLDFLHPGIPITYFSALLLSIFKNIETVEGVILLSRAGLIFLNLIFIYLGSRIVLKQDLSTFFVLITILLLYPAGFLLIDNVSPNSILFGLGTLIISLGFRVVEKFSFKKLVLFSFIFGLTISIKYTSIIIAIPFIFALIFIKNNANNKYFLLKILIIFFSVTSASIYIICWPIAPVLPLVLTQIPILVAVIEFLSSIHIYLISFLIFIIIFFFIFIIKQIKNKNLASTKIYILVSGLIFLYGALYSVTSFFNTSSFTELGISLRHLLPVLAISIIFLPKNLSNQYYFISKPYTIFLIFILCLFVKILFNNYIYTITLKEDQEFSSFIEKISIDNDHIVFYPISVTPSKKLFLAWSDYRYGDINKSFFDEINNMPFKINHESNKFKILNSRHFNLPDPKNKTSTLYLNTINDNNLFTNSQQKNAMKQLSLLSSKSLCNELFNGYSKNKSSIIIFPASLYSYSIGNDASKPDLAISYLKVFRNEMSKKCNFKTILTQTLYKDQRLYLLKIL